jgi:hypothetical protein
MIEHLKNSDWDGVVEKVQHKLANWKWALLSLEGRLTMVNVILSAVPLYMLSLYKIPVKFRKRIDTIRCRFFCQGSSNHRKKITLVVWKKLCLLKEVGGLGILDFAQ